jgi:DNA-binding CsgD family transcriptional regulator/tetratricopeptide (TPR) repeat protein
MEAPLDFAEFPIVGREEIQERIRRGLVAGLRGEGTTLLLVGERGVGKSRLCEWAREEGGRGGLQVVWGRAHEAESNLPYSLASDAFLPLLRDLPSETLDLLSRGRVQELEPLLPGLAVTRRSPGPPEGMASAEARVRSLWAFSELLGRLAERTPILLVLEDLQWADPSSLELLHFLARRAEGRPVLMLLTRDDVLLDGRSSLGEMERSLLSRRLAEKIVLPPLSLEQTGQLVRGAFGVEAAAGEFITHLHRWTQGNPFFLEETLQALVRSGQLYRKGGVWLGWEVRDFDLPRTVREAILARLDPISGEARSVAELIAVLGSRAPLNLLQVLSPLPEAELLEELHRLVAAGILLETLSQEGVVCEFPQVLIRETLLRELGLGRAQRLHGRVARDLERHFGERVRDFAELMAYHELHAAGQGTPRAVRYLVLAGRNALRRFGNAEAGAYFAAALSLMERDHAEDGPESLVEGGRPGVLRELASALTEQGRYEEAVERWEEAHSLAREAGSLEDAAECRRSIGMIRVSQGRPGEALDEFDRILASRSEGLSPSLRARTRLHRGVALEQLGRPREAREELEGVLEELDAQEDPSLPAEAHRVLFNLHMWEGDPEKVRYHAGQALDLARRAGDLTVAFWTYWGHAAFEGLLGNVDVMRDLLRQADRVARQARSPILELRSAELTIVLAGAAGEWDTGISVGEQAIAMARALNQQTVLARALVWTALIYLDRGEVELARPLLAEAWDLAGAGEKETLNVHGALPVHIGRTRMALVGGNCKEAIRIGRDGLAMADRAGYRLWALHRLLPLLAQAHACEEDVEGVREIGQRLREDSAAMGHAPGRVWAQACEALVHLLEGRKEEGIRLMKAAVATLEELPLVGDAAILREMLALHLAEHGNTNQGLEELGQVYDTYLRLGAEPEAERIRGVFRKIGARPPRRSLPGDTVLSARETEVARLVAERKSNKAIARELGISPRTVSTHLSHIFQRLGIGSRGELADYIRRES